MRYKALQYAQALIELLEGEKGGKRKEIVKNFITILRKNGDFSRLNHILMSYEKLYLVQNDLVKVYVETPEEITESFRKEIKASLDKEPFFVEKTNPELLAGAVILLNDELLIDASAKTKLQKLIGN